MDYRVESVITLMRDEPHRFLTLSTMARSVNLSASRLHSLFNAEISMPPARYLRIVRLEAAKHLLETTFLSVKEIVALVGCNDVSHFLCQGQRNGTAKSARGPGDNSHTVFKLLCHGFSRLRPEATVAVWRIHR